MVDKVKIGKKYKRFCGKLIFECIFINEDKSAVFRFKHVPDGRWVSNTYTSSEYKNFTEYKEPVVHKRYVVWYKMDYSPDTYCGVFLQPQSPYGHITLKVQEVSYTEGE